MARATAFLRRELKRNTPRRLRQAQRMRTDSFLVEFRRILVRSAFPRLRWRNISPSRKIIFGECEAAFSSCFFLNFAVMPSDVRSLSRSLSAGDFGMTLVNF